MRRAFPSRIAFGKALLAVTLLIVSAEGNVARADHGHIRFGVGVHFGYPMGWYGYYPPPYYYYPPAYYYPPVVRVPATPPTYIERGSVPPASAQTASNWYYCTNPQGYYPYVKECPGGWQAVSPQPPGTTKPSPRP